MFVFSPIKLPSVCLETFASNASLLIGPVNNDPQRNFALYSGYFYSALEKHQTAIRAGF